MLGAKPCRRGLRNQAHDQVGARHRQSLAQDSDSPSFKSHVPEVLPGPGHGYLVPVMQAGAGDRHGSGRLGFCCSGWRIGREGDSTDCFTASVCLPWRVGRVGASCLWLLCCHVSSFRRAAETVASSLLYQNDSATALSLPPRRVYSLPSPPMAGDMLANASEIDRPTSFWRSGQMAVERGVRFQRLLNGAYFTPSKQLGQQTPISEVFLQTCTSPDISWLSPSHP